MSGDFDEKNDLNKLKKRNSNEKNKDAKKTFKISFDVEKFLDLKISELDVAGQLCQEVAPLATQLRTAERKQKEISRLFTECDEQLQQFQESLSLSPTPEEDCKSPVRRSVEEVIIDDSDEDDIVFIEATIPAVSRRKTPALFPSTAPSAVPTHSLLKPIATSYTGAVVYSARDASLESPPAGSSPKMIQLRAALTAKLNEQTGISPQHSGNSAVRKLNTQEMVGPPPSTKIVTPVMPKASSPTKPAPASAGVLINDTHYGGIKMTVGMKLLGKKFNDIWYKGTLTDIQHIGRPRDQQRYRVKFDGKGLKILTGRNLAYWETPENMIKVGSRVVAMYRDEDTTSSNSFYAGIVAEPLSVRNNHRLLVFFDDGYAQYCTPGEIHKVCEQSVEVWRDIHPDSQDFIREYLKQYPERPMVRLQKGQVVKTEWNGRWWTARVMEVDASLAKMFFDADKRTEWIYRGSTRLEPLYTALCKAAMASEQSGKARRNNPATMKGVKKPFVEYMRGAEEEKRSQMANAQLSSPIPTPAPTNKPALNRQVSNSSSSSNSSNKKRSVAKKSTGGKSQENEGNWEAPWLKRQRPKSCEGIQRQNRYQTSSISNQTVTPDMASVLQQRLAKCEDTDMDDEAQGERSDITNLPARDASRRKYEPHMCSRQCNEIMDDDPKVHRGSNPLLIPMLCGWERQITKTKPLSKRLVMYRAPCGRRFRNIDEVDKFLFDTDCSLTIDLFCFDPVLHTDKEFVPVKTFCDIKDLSYGKETVPISCVNGIDRQYPDYVEYSNQRTPCQGVSIPLDPNFLVCCDCTDGCQDKSKCACCQMTIEASGVTTGGRPDPSAGYQDRRLKEPLLTGIYECNSQCRCDSRCHNRVAQNGLALRLQVFKTENRGWGLRCLDDIPCGGFLCIYAGQLLTEQGANEDGQTYGDEYLAELDYMEVVERHKDGYESDVPESDRDDADEEEEDDDEDVKSHNSDSDFDGGELDNSKSDIQELRTLPARSIKHHDVASTPHKAADRLKEMSVKDALDGEMAPSGEEQQGDSDELPDVDPDSLSKKSSNAPKESRVKNLPDPSKSYIRAHRSMVSAHHKPSKEKLNDEKEEPIGTRHYFHDGQQCYVMDAKSMGNIGRYLNHSCSPNVFVQNVFVDTHDLRFPWVAFFAGKYIRQGTELTWDYNYEVGSVPGKILYCYCGSAECRGRLL